MEEKFRLSAGQKLRLIGKYLRGCYGFFAAALALSCLGTVFNALTPQIVRLTVDSVLGSEPPALPAWLSELLHWDTLRQNTLRALIFAAAAVLLAAAARSLCTYGQRVTLSRGSERYVKSLRDGLYRHIQRLSFAWHKANPTGDIIQRCTSDVDVIRSFVCNQLVEVLRTVFLLVVYLVIMFRMNWHLALAAVLFIPVTAVSSGIFYGKISSSFEAADEAEGDLTTCAQENLTGVRVVRAFGRERYEDDKFQKKNALFSELWIRLGKVLSVYWASGTLLTALQVLVIVTLGIVECVNGNLKLGGFLAFVSYNEALTWPVRSLGRVLSEMSKAGVSMDRVGYILQAQEEQDAPDAKPLPKGDIVFDHVTFAYEGQEVLRDLSFTVRRGETFAILGGTGSGKSTLVQLLARLYDVQEGKITVGGVDLREISRQSLRRGIGLVLQEPFLFSQTIRENIAAACPDATDERIREAARIACVDDAVESFPQGYDTVIGERGVTLSGGQKQRIAIARMLLQKTPVIIFDDSLSAVDAETDARIRAALHKSLSGTTVILVSHRITTLMQADHILVLEDGMCSDFGTHAELISRKGIYRDIYDIQMSSDDRALLEEGGEPIV